MNPSSLFSSAVLVEDEPNLTVTLQIALRKLGIPTLCASTVQQGKQLIADHQPEFVLLDRSLPDGDGLEICSWLRAKNSKVVILVLTASGQIQDKVRGLNAGADDYLSKPFSWEELEARIGALARRIQPSKPEAKEAQLGLWQMDEDRLRIFGPKGWVELTPLEFKLAASLIQKQGTIISRNKLLSEVWGFTLMPKTRTVDHFLSRLRKYFEKNPETPEHFLTIRGAGYRFEF